MPLDFRCYTVMLMMTMMVMVLAGLAVDDYAAYEGYLATGVVDKVSQT